MELLRHETTERVEGLTTVLGGERRPELRRGLLETGGLTQAEVYACLHSVPCAMIGLIPTGELPQRRQG